METIDLLSDGAAYTSEMSNLHERIRILANDAYIASDDAKAKWEDAEEESDDLIRIVTEADNYMLATAALAYGLERDARWAAAGAAYEFLFCPAVSMSQRDQSLEEFATQLSSS